MSTVCPKCGLNKDLCVCETLAKEKERIKVYVTKRRYGKQITVIEGLTKDVDPKSILKQLKSKLACGGTLKDGIIELQGTHRDKAKDVLLKLGFSEEQIDVR